MNLQVHVVNVWVKSFRGRLPLFVIIIIRANGLLLPAYSGDTPLMLLGHPSGARWWKLLLYIFHMNVREGKRLSLGHYASRKQVEHKSTSFPPSPGLELRRAETRASA